jgi:hypothetical protein
LSSFFSQIQNIAGHGDRLSPIVFRLTLSFALGAKQNGRDNRKCTQPTEQFPLPYSITMQHTYCNDRHSGCQNRKQTTVIAFFHAFLLGLYKKRLPRKAGRGSSDFLVREGE